MKTMVTLVRREFWEHRVFLIAPAVMSVLYLALSLLAGTRFSPTMFVIDGSETSLGPAMQPTFYLLLNIVFTMLLYALMAVVVFAYLCDALYNERKDRSILFWKSMPVSDSMTVLSKLLVALIAVPLVVFAFAFVANVLSFIVFRINFGPVAVSASDHWASLDWLHLQALLLMDVLILALWFAPIAAYQLLVSVAVPRAAMVWTVLPPLILIFGQRLFFNSWSLAGFTGDRLGGVVRRLPNRDIDGVAGLFDKANLIELLWLPSLWIGLAAAALMLYVTIRIRRHRDDA